MTELTQKQRKQQAEYYKNWIAKHPGYAKQKQQEWWAKHPNYAAERRKDSNYVAKRRVQKQKWAAEHPEYFKQRKREWLSKDKNAAKLLLTTCKARAKKRNLNFSLTLSWVEKKLAAGFCERTGIVFDRLKGIRDPLGGRNPWFPSIDRINSSFGYTETNCQMVCTIYNMAKQEWSHDEVMKLALALTKDALA